MSKTKAKYLWIIFGLYMFYGEALSCAEPFPDSLLQVLQRSKALDIRAAIENKNGVASLYNNIGLVYKNIGT